MNAKAFLASRPTGLRSFFVAGFCALAIQVISYKLMTTSGLGDAIAVAISLTAFVALSGLGALMGNRLTVHQARGLEAVFGLYAVLLFGAIHVFGMTTYIGLLSWLGEFGLMAQLVLIAPMALLLGALIPAYETRTENQTNFVAVYGAFHIGGAVSLLALELYLTSHLGWVMTGLGLGLVAVLNAAIPPAAGVTMTQAQNSSRPARVSHVLWLAALSVMTGFAGMSTYKAADYLVGPSISNYAVFTAGIFLGLGVAAVLARSIRISFRSMLALSGIGLILVCAVPVFLPMVTGSLVKLTGSADAVYLMLLLGYGAIAYTLMGLSIPVAVNAGMSGALALFVVSVANALGYWLYVGLGEWNVDLAILMGAGLLFALCRLAFLPVALALAAGLLMAPPLINGSLHDNIIARRLFSNALQEYHGQEIALAAEPSWNRHGWPTTRIKAHVDDLLKADLLVVNGLQSLSFMSPDWLKYAESKVSLVPTLFVDNPERALVLGAGTGVTASALSDFYQKVDLVDLNPSLFETMSHFKELSGWSPEGNVQLHQDEAMSYVLKQQGPVYNLIYSTVTGAGYSFSAALYTKEFFEMARGALAPGGIFGFWVDGRTSVTSAMMIIKSLKSTFKHVKLMKVWPHSQDGPAKTPYMTVFASDTPFELAQGHEDIWAKMSDLNPRTAATGPVSIDQWLERSEMSVCDLSGVPGSDISRLTFAKGYKNELEVDYKADLKPSTMENVPYFCFRNIDNRIN